MQLHAGRFPATYGFVEAVSCNASPALKRCRAAFCGAGMQVRSMVTCKHSTLADERFLFFAVVGEYTGNPGRAIPCDVVSLAQALFSIQLRTPTPPYMVLCQSFLVLHSFRQVSSNSRDHKSFYGKRKFDGSRRVCVNPHTPYHIQLHPTASKSRTNASNCAVLRSGFLLCGQA